MEKHFDPAAARERWNREWDARGVFKPDDRSTQPPFVIVLPPPNVTGVLHVGHILGDTVQDHLIRWKHMRGFNTLWIPGTDHAGIATQKVVEVALAKQGKRRADMTRDDFLAEAWKWKEHHHARIVEQMKQLGCAFDWSREAFTLDEPRSRAVREVFVRLYEKGLIYRGDYIVNWCPLDQTAISDEEVQYEEREGKLYWIRYPSEHGDVVVATTRPETMLGDTGVAVSPDDPAKQSLVGKTCTLPIVGRTLPIVADAAVQKDFGSGFVKVTPAHDPIDFGIGKRHNLAAVVVIDRAGKMTAQAGPEFAGLDRFEARKKVIERLEAGRCDREGRAAPARGRHPRPLRHRDRAASVDAVVREDEPARQARDPRGRERRDHVLSAALAQRLHVVDDEHPRLVHLAPAVVGTSHSGVVLRRLRSPDGRAHRSREVRRLRQCEDSARTKTCSTRGSRPGCGRSRRWVGPTRTRPTSKRYHPTSVLVTGLGDHLLLGRAHDHGLARVHGRGSVPPRVLDRHRARRHRPQDEQVARQLARPARHHRPKWGTDAFRFTLSMLSPPGKDVFFDEAKLELGRNFTNKMWQASRLVMGAVEKEPQPLFKQDAAGDFASSLAFAPEFSWEDRWILSALSRCASDTNRCFEEWRLNDGATRIYDFFWHDFCDWYLELAKVRLYGEGDRRTVLAVMVYVLGESMKLLHPLMPYITEEIASALPTSGGRFLLEQSYPVGDEGAIDTEAEGRMQLLRDVVISVRNVRAAYRVNPGARIPVRVRAPARRRCCCAKRPTASFAWRVSPPSTSAPTSPRSRGVPPHRSATSRSSSRSRVSSISTPNAPACAGAREGRGGAGRRRAQVIERKLRRESQARRGGARTQAARAPGDRAGETGRVAGTLGRVVEVDPRCAPWDDGTQLRNRW